MVFEFKDDVFATASWICTNCGDSPTIEQRGFGQGPEKKEGRGLVSLQPIGIVLFGG
jgi:hypothetical protein